MGGALKHGMLLLAAVCVAAMLAACGDSDSTSSTAAETTAPTTTAEGKPEGGGKESKQGGGKQGGGSTSQQGGGSEEEEEDLPDERSSTFRTPGGDNSIQEYGSEADAEERAKATETISTFYSASANEEFAKICGILSAKNKVQLKVFSEKVPKLKGKGCTGVLALITPKSQSRPPETIDGEVISLRSEGDLAFALYHGVDGKDYAYALKLEEGEWKLTALAPTPLSF